MLDDDFRDMCRRLFGCSPEQFFGVGREPEPDGGGWDANGSPVEAA